MAEFDSTRPDACGATAVMGPPQASAAVLWLQGVTLAWMLIEVGVSAFAAWTARSPAMLAFGADSVVELLSAIVVLLQFAPGFAIPTQRAARMAGGLLFVLAGVVAVISGWSVLRRVDAGVSCSGIGITMAALVAMPVLAALKGREARRTGDAALAADAVQSATCAYLAAIALAGLAFHAFFHVAWVDPAAGLLAVPFLVQEGRRAWRGQTCGCC